MVRKHDSAMHGADGAQAKFGDAQGGLRGVDGAQA